MAETWMRGSDMDQLSFDDLERYLPVPGYEGLYEVSDHGNVRSLRKPRADGAPMRTSAGEWGHLRLKLCRDGRRQHWAVHRLVALAFIGPCPDGMEVRHLDGNPANNRWAPGSTPEEARAAGGNLFYGTHAENMQDLIEHGTSHWANQAHCINGHELTADSTYVQYHPDGRIKKRMCRRYLN